MSLWETSSLLHLSDKKRIEQTRFAPEKKRQTSRKDLPYSSILEK